MSQISSLNPARLDLSREVLVAALRRELDTAKALLAHATGDDEEDQKQHVEDLETFLETLYLSSDTISVCLYLPSPPPAEWAVTEIGGGGAFVC